MKFLIATDGSPEADLAVSLGKLLNQMVASELMLLTVIKHESERKKAAANLARAEQLLDGISPQISIRIGSVADEIVQQAIEGSFEMIIMGEKSRHGLTSRWLAPTVLAPTVERVISQMPCPVLIARGEIRPLHHVLLCESGRTPSLLNRLINQLSPLLNQVDALTALHVMSQMAAAPGIAGWELRADADELMKRHTIEGALLEEDLARLAQLNVSLEAKVRHGLVVREILDEMQTGNYDLVVIGAHQSRGWERFLLDDLARELIRQADRPLLVV